jgi:hypothetical protein
VVADTGNITIVCQDSSTNGIIVNGDPFRGRSILLMDGDELVLGDARSLFSDFGIHKYPAEPPLAFMCENFAGQAATQTQATQVPPHVRLV